MRISRHNSLSQLALAACGYVLTIALLDSGGLAEWSRQLDVNNASVVAVSVTSKLERALAPLGVSAVRKKSLAALDRLGWGDDPARLAAARTALIAKDSRSVLDCVAAPAPITTLSSTSPRTVPGIAPVLSAVPRQTVLTPLPQLSAGQHRTVALVGDSMMAVGLSDILLRRTADNGNLRMVRAFRSGTGLARPDVFDWMQEYPAMIAGQEPDAIYVAIGANDAQGFVENGKVLAFGTSAWTTVYEERTAAFLNLLTAHGAHVVWIGLPPMKSGAYDAKMAQINRIAYSVVSRNPLAVWWSPADAIGDTSGSFRDFGVVSTGKTVRLRAPDGIHLSDDGATLLAPSLLSWLNASPAQDAAQVAQADSSKSIRSAGRRAMRQ